ncbi:LytR/AlgR family response regulator transcription factor [Flavihumibacter petaseus]|uniref:Putative two-component response regulator n=1 Tax=Flavihumibacter petaseus NBRC 106054 TaxID=1220578 RepID=A0A0E9MY77_9BACT|nr:LytTR family DNA-binding domain-containing protein [Flavihumibacter petaseus]GAO42544.1 putative two-component response regulator [Flavihumibacter petaseus NBRC 106054]
MNAVIVEDESLIARELARKISQVAPDIRIIETISSLKMARKWFLANAEPDLIFMDIQLSDGTSFEILEAFQIECPIIFTTAYDEYAIQAFRVNSIDYLLKPVDIRDLERAIEKSRKRIASPTPQSDSLKELLQYMQHPAAAAQFKEKFIVNVRNNWIPVPTRDIACFYRDNLNYLHTFSGDKYILDYTTLEEIEELLDPRVYYRANRQYIVHIDAIQSVKPHENQKLTLTLKAPLKIEADISREKAPGFKKWFER